MRAKKLEDIVVYGEAVAAAKAISAILERPPVRRDFDLKDQLSRSTRRIAPLIAEGFGQLTDRHLADYLARARGSSLESQAHLRDAAHKRYISEAEFTDLHGKYVIIGKRLSRWIHHLRESDWKNRG